MRCKIVEDKGGLSPFMRRSNRKRLARIESATARSVVKIDYTKLFSYSLTKVCGSHVRCGPHIVLFKGLRKG